MKKTCLSCIKYLGCTIPGKSFNFHCSKYVDINKPIVKKAKKVDKKEKLAKPAIKKKKAYDDDNFSDVVDQVIKDERKSPLPRDLRIDDRDIPLAPNFYTYVTSPKFIDVKPFPFASQLEIGTKYNAEWCYHCTDRKYFKNVPVDDKPEDFKAHVKLLKFGVCPKCGATKREMWKKGLIRVPCELVGLAGQRSGKSMLFSFLATYHLHNYLKSPSPQQLFGLLATADLHAQYTALTYEKAKALLWNPIYNVLTSGKWFKDYYQLLDHYGNKYGEELYIVKDTFARFRHKKLFAYPVGPDRNKIRGTTAFQGGIDEIGLFDSEESDKVKMNGDEVWTSLRNSFRTLRSAYYKRLKKDESYNSILPPFLGAISSPLSKKDMIVRLYERSKTSEFMFGFHRATWEMNPDVTREDLEDDFKIDFAKALRDFGAVPPNSSLPYIPNLDVIRSIIALSIKNKADLMPISSPANSGEMYRSGQITYKTPKDRINRIMALDAGSRNNHFGLALGYYDLKLNKPIFDCLLELKPSREEPINFNFMYNDVIKTLIQDMNVKLVVSDRFQNLKILHDIQSDFDILVKTYSVKYRDFITYKSSALNGEFSVPCPEMPLEKIEKVGDKNYPQGFFMKPVSHFLHQMLTVRDNEKEVSKGDNTTDDIFRAVVLAYSFLINPDYRELISGEEIIQQKKRMVFGAVGSFSRGQTGVNSYKNLGVVGSFSYSRKAP